MRVLIIDDEPLSRRAMRQLLAAHADVEIAGEGGDVVEAEELVARLAPDVVFLDIRMPGLSGLDWAALRSGGSRAPAVPLLVFVTAFEAYALPAFDVAPVDYLTKPVLQPRLDRALERLRDRLALMAGGGPAAGVVSPASPGHLVSRVRDTDVLIPLDTIELIESDDVYASVRAGGKRHLVRTSLDALERALDTTRFLRVHRSFIVPLARVTAVRLVRGGRRELVLQGGVVVPVSRRRREELDAALRRRSIHDTTGAAPDTQRHQR